MRRKNKLLLGLTTLLIISLLVSTEIVQGKTTIYKDPEDFENAQFIPVLDIWVNVSSATALQFNENTGIYTSLTNSGNEQWQLKHYWIVPKNDKIKWQVFDPNLEIIEGLFGNAIHRNYRPSFFPIQSVKAVEQSDPGYERFNYRDLQTVNDFQDSKVLAGDTGGIVDLNSTYINSTTLPSQSNYVYPDLQTDGVYYFADDSKSAYDYAKDMAEKDGVTLYGLVNASAIGFAYSDTYDSLDSVVWAFDEVATSIPLNSLPDNSNDLNSLPDTPTNSPQVNGYVLKRYRISLHQMQKQLSSLGGKVVKTIKNTDFRKIGSYAIAASPVGASYYFAKKIGPAFHKLPMKVGSLASGLLKSATNVAIAIIAVLVLVAILALVLKIVF